MYGLYDCCMENKSPQCAAQSSLNPKNMRT
jgi:hypothetical protein